MTRPDWRFDRASAFLAGASLAAVMVAAIAAQAPARNAAPGTQAGTGVLAGVITTNDAQPQPLHAAVVMLSPGSGPIMRVVTDDEGRFAVSGLGPENYRITVSKPAYITTEYGATRITGAGTPITLAAGQQLTNLAIRVPRGAVITGTVFDFDGTPLPNMIVAAFPGYGAEPALTDDRGVYRIYGLKPDDYVVAATPRATAAGGVTMTSPVAVDAALAELERAHARGAGPIGGAVATGSGRAAASPPPATDPGPRYSLAPVYYPGTITRDDATIVTLRESEERSGVDFALMLSGTTKVSGVILGPDGIPAIGSATTGVPAPVTGVALPAGPPTSPALTVTVNPRVATVAGTYGLRPQVTTNQKDGTFVVTNLTPGSYTVSVRVMSPIVPRPADAGEPAAPSVRPLRLWALADVDVGSTDVTGLTLTLRPALTMTGRIVFDRTTLAPPSDLSRIRVALRRPAPAPGENAEAPVVTATRADGTFEVSGIMPGNYQLTVALPASTPAGWTLRSAVINGRDLLDLPPFSGRDDAGDLRGVVVTFSDRHTRLTGRLETSSGTPAPSHFIVAFPAERQLWHSLSRRVVFTRPATNGIFTIADLPPGEYLLAALSDLDTLTWRRSEFLEQLVPASVKVTIRDGAPTTQDLRIAR